MYIFQFKIIQFFSKDFVVGAPFEQNPLEPSASGAIYIFRGKDQLSAIKLSQKIYASEIQIPQGFFSPQPAIINGNGNGASPRFLNGFGYSLSGGLDLDASGYPDLAVGALKSNAVVLLRSLPVVYVDAFVGNEDNLLDIDQKRKECRQDDGTELVCFNFDLCFQLNEKKVNRECF